MKKFLSVAVILLMASSCSTMNERSNKIKPIAGSMGVNGHGYITFSKDNAFCSGAITPEDMIKDFTKASEWDKQEKTMDIDKEINSYTSCLLTVKYHYSQSSKESMVNVCYRDMGYQYLNTFVCESFKDYAGVLKELKNSDAKVKEINSEIAAADKLK